MFVMEKMLPVLILALLLFGGTKIPELMRGLGQGMKEFKKATRDDDDDTTIKPGTTTVVTSAPPTPIEAPKTETKI